jgi:hypothetical protein
MTTITICPEAEVRAFAAEFGHLPNVARMVAMCEAGTITWAQAHKIARQALAAGISAVTS